MSPKQMFFEIFTDRLDDTRNFFVDVIGFAVTRADEGFLVLQRGTAKLHVGSLDHMSLDQVDAGHLAAPTGRGVQLCIEVEDIDAAFANAEASGHAITSPLTDQWFGKRDFRMFDPNGIYVRGTSPRLRPA